MLLRNTAVGDQVVGQHIRKTGCISSVVGAEDRRKDYLDATLAALCAKVDLLAVRNLDHPHRRYAYLGQPIDDRCFAACARILVLARHQKPEKPVLRPGESWIDIIHAETLRRNKKAGILYPRRTVRRRQDDLIKIKCITVTMPLTLEECEDFVVWERISLS